MVDVMYDLHRRIRYHVWSCAYDRVIILVSEPSGIWTRLGHIMWDYALVRTRNRVYARVVIRADRRLFQKINE